MVVGMNQTHPWTNAAFELAPSRVVKSLNP